MKSIPLSQAKFATVDDCDYEWLRQWTWFYDDGYARRIEKRPRRSIRMHRVILERMGHVDFKCVDHKDGNRTNNRRKNLRPATNCQNTRNRKPLNRTTPLKGVSYMRKVGRYRAQIAADGVNQYLGLFDDPKDAARAYNKAAAKLHGEFARLNEEA